MTPAAQRRASRSVYEAALEAVSDGVRTADLGGQATTSEFTNEVIRRVKEAVAAVQAEQAAREAETGVTVQVERVELMLRAVAQRRGGGNISLRVPVLGQEIGGGVAVSRQQLQTIELSLVPPAVVAKGIGKWDIKNELAGAILGIEEGVRKAAQAEPKFELGKAAVELNLVVGRDGRLSLVGEGSAGQETAHTVRVYLKPRPPSAA